LVVSQMAKLTVVLLSVILRAAAETSAILEMSGDAGKIIWGKLENPVCELILDRANTRLNSTCDIFTTENDLLKAKVSTLEAKVSTVEADNAELMAWKTEMEAKMEHVLKTITPPPPNLPPSPPPSPPPAPPSTYMILLAAINSTSAVLTAGTVQLEVCTLYTMNDMRCYQSQVSTSQHWSDSTPNFYIMANGYTSDTVGDVNYQYGYMSNTNFDTFANIFTMISGVTAWSYGSSMHPQPYLNECTDFVATNEDVHGTEPWAEPWGFNPIFRRIYFSTLDAEHTNTSVVAVAGSFCP